MANNRDLIESIRKDLKKSRIEEPRTTSKQVVEQLVEDIHAHLKAGARLEDVHEVISARLTDDTKMTLNTFKRYWREARDAAGLPKIRNSGRKKRLLHTNEPGKMEGTTRNQDSARNTSKDTSSDFREDPDNI